MIVSPSRRSGYIRDQTSASSVHVVVEEKKERRPLPSLFNTAAASFHCEALSMLREIAERICEEFCAAQKTNCSFFLFVCACVLLCSFDPNEKYCVWAVRYAARELQCHQLLYSTQLKIMINKTFLYFYITSMFSTHYARFLKCTPCIIAI